MISVPLVVWLVYAAVGITLELIAVFDKTPNDTISANTWKFLGIKGFVVTHTSLRRMALVAGLAVLSVHLLTGYI